MTMWDLPQSANIGGTEYEIHADYRDILEIMEYLNDADQPEYLRWYVAVALFYEGEIPEAHLQEAMEYLASFISYGEQDDARPSPKLLDWEQDAQVIVADVNKAAGAEVRALPYLHWWTFLSYFHAIGEGQLSTLVSIRNKLYYGKPLEKWEQEYYRKNQEKVDLKRPYSAAEEAVFEQFQKLLEGGCGK